MINTSNYTSKDNPPRRLAEPVRLTQPAQPTRPRTAATDATERPGPARFGRILAITGHVLVIAGRVVASWLAAIPRRLGDRLFAMNDTEAYWRGWQITKTRGGLARSYRDPRFDALAECPKCRGTSVTAELSCLPGRGTGVIAEPSCLPCRGTGRITRGEVS